MATQLQIRRGTTAQMNAFTGAEGELAVNTSTDTVHVHDGATAGGFALAKADGSNIATYAGSFTTISASGAITGNVTGNLTGNVTGNVTGDVTGDLTGSVLTAAQTNITSVGTLSALTVTGEITANGGIALGDSDKATFGGSDDLQIYHDGSNSYITDTGDGSLYLRGSNQVRIESATGEKYFIANANADTNLYYDNSVKLATTATGIDVTGTVTSSGPLQLTAGALAAAGNAGLSHRSADNKVYLQAGTGGFNILDDQQNTHFAIDSAGVSTFYNSVGIGTGVAPGINGKGLAIFDALYPRLTFRNDTTGDSSAATVGTSAYLVGDNFYLNNQEAGILSFGTNATERMRIAASGATTITANTTSDWALAVSNGTNSNAFGLYVNAPSASGIPLRVDGGGSERMRIDSSGNLLVGTTSTPPYAGIAVGSTSSGKNILVFSSANGSNGLIGLYSSDNTQQGQLYAGTGDINLFGASVVKIVASTGGVKLNTNATSWVSNSDERAKYIIEPITNAAQKVSTLRAVIGKYKTDSEETRRSFLIAQDVQAVLPEAVDATDEDNLGVRYTETIPLLVAAIKEQQATIEALTQRIQTLENN